MAEKKKQHQSMDGAFTLGTRPIILNSAMIPHPRQAITAPLANVKALRVVGRFHPPRRRQASSDA